MIVIQKPRNAYFPSSGSPGESVAYDTYWQDTSQATALAGVWDTPSDSPDTDLTITGSITAEATSHLVAQFVFPAFGEFVPPIVALPSGYAPLDTIGLYRSAVVAAKCDAERKSGGWGFTIRLQGSIRIFDTDGVFKYYLDDSPTSATGGFNSQIDAYQVRVVGVRARRQWDVPVSSDFLVFEIGYRCSTGAGTTWDYEIATRFGDAYADYLPITPPNQVTTGNAGFKFYWAVDQDYFANTGQMPRYHKPVMSRRLAQFPVTPVANRNDDILNEMLLNEMVL